MTETGKLEARGWKWCWATFDRNWVSLTTKCTKMVRKHIYYQKQDVIRKVERLSTWVRIGLSHPWRHLNQKHDPFPSTLSLFLHQLHRSDQLHDDGVDFYHLHRDHRRSRQLLGTGGGRDRAGDPARSPAVVGMPSSVAANMRQILYGAALVACMMWRPQGLMGKYAFGAGPRARKLEG